MHLDFAAISDVGRVRKDNQDSGYAGPWLLTVCDGVGGAARGDIASSTAVHQLRQLHAAPAEGDQTRESQHSDNQRDDHLLAQVAGALHRAHNRIADLVDDDPALNGTSTTATVALFDGRRLGMGHVGDSRAYLLHDGELRQLTKDHTFVQTLIDEGRITEEESRFHPHRNLILKAIDGNHDLDPDLFHVELAPGDRIFLCSDGASGFLDDERMADILGGGSPDYAATELVRASLEAGSTDNVTCLVADVVEEPPTGLTPLSVGAVADLRRKRGGMTGLFRGHRSGDTGELEPVVDDLPDEVDYAIPSDPVDPEEARYAPRPPARFVWLKRLLAAVIVIGLLWLAAAAAWSWSQRQYYVGDDGGTVTIYRGLNADLPGVSLSQPYERSNVELDNLSDFDAEKVREGMDVGTLTDARRTVENLAQRQRAGSPGDGSTESTG